MKEGFAAHLVLMPHKQVRSAIVLVDECGILREIRALDRETPFTRFYDGAIRVVKRDADPANPGDDPLVGDPVAIWQLYPYDLHAQQQLPNTRTLQIF